VEWCGVKRREEVEERIVGVHRHAAKFVGGSLSFSEGTRRILLVYARSIVEMSLKFDTEHSANVW
jgi:hypothetical protein